MCSCRSQRRLYRGDCIFDGQRYYKDLCRIDGYDPKRVREGCAIRAPPPAHHPHSTQPKPCSPPTARSPSARPRARRWLRRQTLLVEDSPHSGLQRDAVLLVRPYEGGADLELMHVLKFIVEQLDHVRASLHAAAARALHAISHSGRSADR